MVSKVVSLFARRALVLGSALGLTMVLPSSARAETSPEATPAGAPHHILHRTRSPKKKDAGASKRTRSTSQATKESEPPKQSLTPLPTVAASIGAPLAVNDDAEGSKEDVKAVKAHDEPRAVVRTHATEPRHSPLLIQTRANDRLIATPPKRSAAMPTGKTCYRDPIDLIRGAEEEKITLTKCDGSVAPLAVEGLSVLVRPGNAAKPPIPTKELAKKSGTNLAPGIKRIDSRLVERLQTVVDHFATRGAMPKVYLVSGYRPMSAGSFHANGRALDFRIDGVKNEDVVAFCKTLADTGCGFYPNSSFVHVDVRDAGTGHVSWIDASGPGETPKYVAAWPPPKSEAQAEAVEELDTNTDPAHLLGKLDTELQVLPPPGLEAKADPAPSPAEPAAVIGKEIDLKP